MKVRIHVSLKPGVLDPQGRAVHHALEGLGFQGCRGRADRPADRDWKWPTTPATKRWTRCASKLLANMVIENYRIEKVEPLMTRRSRHLPRIELRPRHGGRAARRYRARSGDTRLARRCRPARRPRFHRPARRLFLWRLPALRRDGGEQPDHARRRGGGGARRAGARRVQRLPGADRERSCCPAR